MTKNEIIAELRRCACEDWLCELETLEASDAVNKFLDRNELLDDLDLSDVRTLFLFVAKAM